MVMTTEEQRRAQSESQEERKNWLEPVIETVLPHLATKEDMAISEMRIVM